AFHFLIEPVLFLRRARRSTRRVANARCGALGEPPDKVEVRQRENPPAKTIQSGYVRLWDQCAAMVGSNHGSPCSRSSTSIRLAALNLPSTDETWCSIVRGDRDRVRA